MVGFGIGFTSAIVLVLAGLPIVPHAASGTLTIRGDCRFSCPDVSLPFVSSYPSGVMVTVSWVAQGGAAVTVTMYRGPTSSSGVMSGAACSGEGSQGECSFRSAGGNYTLVSEPVPPVTQSAYWVNYSVEYYSTVI